MTDCDAGGVVIGGERIDAATTLWAAGVAASPAGDWLDVETDGAGRVIVGADLSIDEAPNVFVIGDAAAVTDRRGVQVPGIAPAAKQQGRYVANVIASRIRGRAAPPPFRYRHAGNLATIGRNPRSSSFRSCASRASSLVDLGDRAHLFLDWPAEPADGVVSLALGIRHLRSRRAAHYG